MDIQKTICPRCGEPTEEGLCPRCRVAETEWIVCEPRVTAVYCPTCEAQKRGKTWSDVHAERSELISELAVSAIRLHEDVKGVRITVSSEDPTPNRTYATVEVDATLYTLPVNALCRVEIAWQREQCDRCSRISGGYYEGIVQIRATGRKPNAYEREVAANIAYQTEDNLQEGGERLSFVSSVDETRDGIDIVVGSQHIGQVISQMITGALGGKYTTHPKLVGEKDGKALYRVTYSIRLPYYQKGDVVVSKNRYYEIRNVDTQHLSVFDLAAGTGRTLQESEIDRRIGNVREAEEALVAFTQGNIIGLLDPKTYETREINTVPWLFPAEGAPLRVLRDEETEQLVIVG